MLVLELLKHGVVMHEILVKTLLVPELVVQHKDGGSVTWSSCSD